MRSSTIDIAIPTRDAAPRRRQPSGTQKLQRVLDRIHSSLDTLKAATDRVAERKALADARAYLTNPPPEVQAVRDRAAFDQAWRDRAQRQRQQNKDRQEAADKFFGRTTR
ncbi:hypothetical protein [Methylobacterium sp. J-077]|uniref:hypothetical protein n=1 Tax=Methylobacterium sp. J-077 TaxID=2836656 RepID=UPI001FBAC883|nr:hypothetical protein [Methylobacterium sp. J-077]